MLTTGKKTPAIPRGRQRRNAKAVAAPEFKQPVAAPPVETTPKLDGVEVTSIKPIEQIPGIPMKIAVITLANGVTTCGCLDCPSPMDFTGSRGDVMSHRNAVHGARYGAKRPKIVPESPKEPNHGVELILMPRDDGPAPERIYDMTIGEVLALMPSITALGNLVETAEEERDKVMEELKRLRAYERETRAKLETLDELRDEVVVLRVEARSRANYEQIKQQMYDLKAWKRKITAKLAAAGFQLNEEEQ